MQKASAYKLNSGGGPVKNITLYQQGAGPAQHQVQSGEPGQQDHRRETPPGERSF